jgi:transcription elongation factor Elf1
MVTRRITRRISVRIPALKYTCPHCYHRHELPGVRLGTPGPVSCSRCGRTFNLR